MKKINTFTTLTHSSKETRLKSVFFDSNKRLAISSLNCTQFCYLDLKEGELAVKTDRDIVLDINSKGELIAIYPDFYNLSLNAWDLIFSQNT